jgi:glutathione synthase
MSKSIYPAILPELSADEFEPLLQAVKDYQLIHGSLLKLVASEEEHSVLARPVGVSIFPTQFPTRHFFRALELQQIFNELYARVASDEAWLEETLHDLIESDQFTNALWGVHQAVKAAGAYERQPLSLGVFRSDYMVHLSDLKSRANIMSKLNSKAERRLELKQVELNTYTVAGGTHGNIVAEMHKHLLRSGVYGKEYREQFALSTIHSYPPENDTVKNIVAGLATANRAYERPTSRSATHTGVLMIVQPNNFNVCDERPIEYGLWDQDVPCYRLIWGSEVLQYTTLGPNKELLFTHPQCVYTPLEISVLYMRAGYEPREYQDKAGVTCRLHLEESRAIKCPNILGHLATFKKVQQRLAEPAQLERFLPRESADAIRVTFMPMYPMDSSEQGLKGREIARNAKEARDYVMKPSLEGGGHNHYGEEIPSALASIPEEQWKSYILMKMIDTPPQEGMLMSPRGGYRGNVVSELGVFGVCMWKKEESSQEVRILENKQAGWSFKTKSTEVNEMSVVKGYGCFDTPCLVDL